MSMKLIIHQMRIDTDISFKFFHVFFWFMRNIEKKEEDNEIKANKKRIHKRDKEKQTRLSRSMKIYK